MKKSIAVPASMIGGLFLALMLILTPGSTAHSTPVDVPGECVVDPDPDPPVYYSIDLVSTRKVPGARRADGVGNVMFASSPYGVAISPDGAYVYDLDISINEADVADDKTLSAFVTTPNLDKIQWLGHLGEDNRIRGRVEWNKFLVVITLEPVDSEPSGTWTGPIVSRGMSRSGMMHTMAGHGPFQAEPCAVYGYR